MPKPRTPALAPSWTPPPFTALASQALADRLRLLKYERDAASQTGRAGRADFYGKLATDAGVRFQDEDGRLQKQDQQLARWMRDPQRRWMVLGPKNYARLACHLVKLRPQFAIHIAVPLLRLASNPLFHAFDPIIHSSNRGYARDMMKDCLVGSYRVYRPSILGPRNHGYIARMTIRYDESTESFSSLENYLIPNPKGHARHWDLPGAIFPHSETMFTSVTAETLDGGIQVRLFNNIITNRQTLLSGREQISGFYGWLADRSNGKFYATTFYAETVDPDNRQHDFDLDFVNIDSFPPHARVVLQKSLRRGKEYASDYLHHEI